MSVWGFSVIGRGDVLSLHDEHNALYNTQKDVVQSKVGRKERGETQGTGVEVRKERTAAERTDERKIALQHKACESLLDSRLQRGVLIPIERVSSVVESVNRFLAWEFDPEITWGFITICDGVQVAKITINHATISKKLLDACTYVWIVVRYSR